MTEDINGGTYDVDVEFLGIPLAAESGDICDIKQGDFSIECPVKASPKTEIKGTFVIPDEAPEGDYRVTVSAASEKSEEIFCAEFDFTIDEPTELYYLRSA